MSQSMRATAPSTPLNSIETRMAKGSIAINRPTSPSSSDISDVAISLFFETLAEVGMSDKEAAYTMAMDPAQLSRVKTGQARLPFDAVWRLPVHFWAPFAARIEAAKGINPANEKRERIHRMCELFRLFVEDVA